MIYQKFNLRKFFRSFVYASKGVINLFKTEQNARFHLIVASITAVLVYFLKLTRIEATLIFFAFVMVLAIEIINTAIEKLLDIVHPDNHQSIEFIKDAMAGAVLIASIIAFVVGILVFYPHIASFL